MKKLTRTALVFASLTIGVQAIAQVTMFEDDGFRGRSFSSSMAVSDFTRNGFNDRASSVIVTSDRYEVCDDVGFRGRCVVLRQGNYPSLSALGLNDRVSSVRPVARNARIEDSRYAPAPEVTHDYRRRQNERLFQADVTAVHAVLGKAEQRCWTERERVAGERGEASVPGAIAGAVIGGILGHQVGGGRGRDIATAGGAVAGAAVGANVARGRGPETTRNVQRCADVSGTAKPEYYDVTYRFRGQEHRMQSKTAPGATITVNRQGEPRIDG